MDDNAPYILAIAQTGSISEAARKMHLSQPALSQRLKQLEKHLGAELFDRSRTPLSPTHACDVYLAWARKAIEEEDAMRRDVSEIAQKTTRRLQIGTSVPRANSIFPDLIERFYEERPGCVVFLYEAGVPEHHNRLLSSAEIDCALFTPVRPEPLLFSGEPLCSERMLLVAPSSFKLPSHKPHAEEQAGPFSEILPEVSADCIANFPFIMPPRELKHARLIRSLMDSLGIKLNVAFHSCSNEMTLEMIRRGLGVSLMPNTFVRAHRDKAIVLYSVREIPRSGCLYYNRRPDRAASKDEEIFVRIAREWVQDHSEFKLRTSDAV